MAEERKEVAKHILLALGIIGFVSLALVAPGISKAIPLLEKIDLARINQEIKRLKKRGLVEIVKRKSGLEEIKLTKEGKVKLKSIKLGLLQIEKPQKWDKKWRIIIFDIPIQKNKSRALLRRKIKMLGFYKLQNSVFVHPHPCYEVVRFLREFFGVENEVVYIEAEKIENPNKLIEFFFT